jgi:hypothetical protein
VSEQFAPILVLLAFCVTFVGLALRSDRTIWAALSLFVLAGFVWTLQTEDILGMFPRAATVQAAINEPYVGAFDFKNNLVETLHGDDPNARRAATLSYTRPDRMRLYQTSIVQAEMGFAGAAPVVEFTDASNVGRADVMTTRYVGIELTSPDGSFEIQPERMQQATLSGETSSAFRWEVTPTKSGQSNSLVLTIYSLNPSVPDLRAPLRPIVRETIPVSVGIADIPNVAARAVAANAVSLGLTFSVLGGVMLFLFNAFKEKRPRLAWGIVWFGFALVALPITVSTASLFATTTQMPGPTVSEAADIDLSAVDAATTHVPRAGRVSWSGTLACDGVLRRIALFVEVDGDEAGGQLRLGDEAPVGLSGQYDGERLLLRGASSTQVLELHANPNGAGAVGAWTSDPACGHVTLAPEGDIFGQ